MHVSGIQTLVNLDSVCSNVQPALEKYSVIFTLE